MTKGYYTRHRRRGVLVSMPIGGAGARWREWRSLRPGFSDILFQKVKYALVRLAFVLLLSILDLNSRPDARAWTGDHHHGCRHDVGVFPQRAYRRRAHL